MIDSQSRGVCQGWLPGGIATGARLTARKECKATAQPGQPRDTGSSKEPDPSLGHVPRA